VIPTVRRATGGAALVPLTKATDASLLERFLGAANRLAAPIRAQVFRLLEDLTADAPEALWEAALSDGDITPLFDWLWETLSAGRDVEATLRRMVRQASVTAGEWSFPGGQLSFDVSNPLAVSWLTDYPLPLVRQMSESLRRTLSDIVAEGIAEGLHPREMARTVRATQGFTLTSQQWRAVRNYQRELVARLGAQQRGERPTPLATRALVDRRFTTARLTADKVETMVARYAERMRRYRSEMIARTESIRAMNAGNWLALHYAAEQGLVRRDDLVRRWIPAPDNATGGGPCPVCLDIALRNEAGVAFDEPFVLNDAGETIMFPPAHPHCRCLAWTRPRLFAGETFQLSDAYLPRAHSLRGRPLSPRVVA
jgi:hypothetical protein